MLLLNITVPSANAVQSHSCGPKLTTHNLNVKRPWTKNNQIKDKGLNIIFRFRPNLFSDIKHYTFSFQYTVSPAGLEVPPTRAQVG